MPTPEGIVLSKCKDILKQLELQGKVVHYERMNVGMTRNMQGYLQQQGRVGTSDLFVFVKCDEICWILLLEVKRPDGGKQSDVQIEFENKFIGLHNVIYALVTDHKQIKELVDNVRRKSKNYGKIEDWELPDLII